MIKFSKYTADYSAIIRLGLPILIGQLGMIVVGFADNIMVGHYSTEALASASFVNNLFNVAIFCCIGFTYGLTPIVGSYFTQKRHGDIGAAMRTGVVLNVIFTLAVMAIMTAIYFNVDRLGQPEQLLPLIRPYFLIYLAGMLPISVFNVFAQWSYGINDTRLPMWIILGSNVVNIIGNYALIFGHFGLPELGLTGAGISTLIARCICPVVIICCFVSLKKNRRYFDAFRSSRVNMPIVRKIWRISIPISMQMTFESGSFTMAAVMTGWISAIDLAAFQVIVIIGTLGFCIYYSVGSAVTILVSNEAGRDDRKAMRRVAWSGYHVLLLLMAISSAIFIFFGRDMMKAFTDDPAVLALTSSLIFPLVLYQAGDATQINFAGALRGTSKVMPMLWIAFFSYIVIGVPATYALGFPAGLGSYGIILSFSVSLFIAAALFLTFFLKATRTPKKTH
ncbi:MAG: MATE family efflux transporter [Muribaculaceae bacterium]|nr:MATE family efflux transporter [Muribaculaceae bacterium]